MIHIGWMCSKIMQFWSSIHHEINSLFNLSLKLSPACLLHLKFKLGKQDTVLLNNLLVAVKILIAKNSKSPTVPIVYEWRTKCHYVFLMTKLSAIKSFHNGSELALQSFHNTWSKFIDYWKVKPNDMVHSEFLGML